MVVDRRTLEFAAMDEVLTAALEACEVVDDISTRIIDNDGECPRCGGTEPNHDDCNPECELTLARRALELARVKGVL
jgi:hypothetical protein